MRVTEEESTLAEVFPGPPGSQLTTMALWTGALWAGALWTGALWIGALWDGVPGEDAVVPPAHALASSTTASTGRPEIRTLKAPRTHCPTEGPLLPRRQRRFLCVGAPSPERVAIRRLVTRDVDPSEEPSPF